MISRHLKMKTRWILSALGALVLLNQPVSAEPAPESMVRIPEGSFVMGTGKAGDEPEHRVTLSAYTIDKYEVTQAQYKKIMGKNPSSFKGDDLPVEQVTWYEARDYCKKTGKRLPTEAEWERAARADSEQAVPENDNRFWYWENSGRTTHPVGTKQPNAFGLYDMLGNVWEWTADFYSDVYYRESPERDPKGPFSGKYRVIRGGSWRDLLEVLRPSRRNYDLANGRFNHIGFRCVKDVTTDEH